jgi:hypothetical protein
MEPDTVIIPFMCHVRNNLKYKITVARMNIDYTLCMAFFFFSYFCSINYYIHATERTVLEVYSL